MSDLIELMRKHAEAQQQMAANTREDFTVWHHMGVADVLLRAIAEIERLSRRL